MVTRYSSKWVLRAENVSGTWGLLLRGLSPGPKHEFPTMSSSKRQFLLVLVPFDSFDKDYAAFKKSHSEFEIKHYKDSNEADQKPTISDEDWKTATILITLFTFPQSKKQAPNLKWIHLYSAGINQALNQPLFKSDDIVWTSGNGVHAPQISEWVFTTALAHFHQTPTMLKWQEVQEWHAADYVPKGDLFQKKLGILGYGAIARHSARIAAGLGMEVVVYTLHEKATPEQKKSDTYTPKHSGDPDGTIPSKWYYGQDQLRQFLSSGLDMLLITLPLTDLTRNLLGKEQFGMLKGAFLSNISRGDILVQDDFIEALNNGTLEGAAVDVTTPEQVLSPTKS